MAISKEKRLEIHRKLPYGWQAEVADMLGIGRSYVCNWVHGRGNSPRIEKVVLWFLQNYNQRQEQKELIVNEFISAHS